MPAFRSDDEEDNLFDEVSRMADRMGLKGEKREVYVDDHMLQGGYGRVQSREAYAKIQQEGEEESGGNRWGFGGGRGRQQRQNQGGNRRDDDDQF